MSLDITEEEREFIPNHEHLIVVLERLIEEVKLLRTEVDKLKQNARG